MTAKNKIRGNRLEYEVVDFFTKAGYNAERAWGSNGRALGYHEQVDVVVRGKEDFKIQCKRRKTLPKYFGTGILLDPTGIYDALVVRQEREKPLICMSLERFIELYYEER